MVFNHKIKERGSFSDKSLIQTLAIKSLKRRINSTFQFFREACAEVGNGLVPVHKLFSKLESHTLDVDKMDFTNFCHYSLPRRRKASPYSRTVLSIDWSISWRRFSETKWPRIAAISSEGIM